MRNRFILLMALSTCILCTAMVCVLITSDSEKQFFSFRYGGMFSQRPSSFNSSSISKPLSAMIVSPGRISELCSFGLRISKNPDLLTISLSLMEPPYHSTSGIYDNKAFKGVMNFVVAVCFTLLL